jgi:stalled ribosome rescue protein Dom34
MRHILSMVQQYTKNPLMLQRLYTKRTDRIHKACKDENFPPFVLYYTKRFFKEAVLLKRIVLTGGGTAVKIFPMKLNPKYKNMKKPMMPVSASSSKYKLCA